MRTVARGRAGSCPHDAAVPSPGGDKAGTAGSSPGGEYSRFGVVMGILIGVVGHTQPQPMPPRGRGSSPELAFSWELDSHINFCA